MARVEGSAKQQNKEKAWLWVKRSQFGITEIELEEKTGIQRRTLNNYLHELEHEGKIYKDGLCWHALNFEGTRLRAFDLSPEEAYTLYLAARLLVKQHDKRNEPAETALMKLAHILTADAGVGDEIAQAAQELASRPAHPDYQDIFRTFVRGYIYRKAVDITYQPLKGKPFDTRFRTYLMEPSAIGYATYAIGHSSLPNALRAYKIERIQSAQLSSESYSVPTDFPGLNILRNAWSIIFGEETVEVVLRFSPQVRKRVQESKWHPSEQSEEDPDKPGWLRWRAFVADTTDMLPWVRGWGADVEIIGPEGLRERVAREMQTMVNWYGVNSIQQQSLDNKLLRCWGKTGKENVEFHPALFHMIDVAHVAQQLLSSAASRRWRQVLGNALNAEEIMLLEWVPWFVSLHDIGKLSVPFQAQNQIQKTRMEAEGFDFGSISPKQSRELHHTITGRLILNELAQEFPPLLRQAFQEMISGHHGVYHRPDTRHRRDFLRLKESDDWVGMRHQAIDTLANLFLLRKPSVWPEPANVSVAIATLNGFTILCDWLGSDESIFKPTPHMDPMEYVGVSRERANRSVEKAGFFAQTKSSAPTNFAALFPDRPDPRPLQLAVEKIPEDIISQPCLAIIEAPTGEGKTEAALTLARRIAALRGTDEFYVALPTTATSNAMFIRIQSYLRHQLGLPSDLVKLVHGQDFLVEDDLRLEPMNNGSEDEHPSLDWFSPKKRSLLAPFGVGTVDQAELSALNVHHNALRMIGLAGKVVILDEVHAYDTYMTTIIEQMLSWLAALGTSVILLSATLPSVRRQGLAKAFTGTSELSASVKSSYPSLLVINKQGKVSQCSPAAYQDGRIIETRHLHYANDDWLDVAHWLADTVKDGGCACWIVNTVQRAQQIYRHLQQVVPQDVDCELLHARFPLEDRQGIEARILDKYGEKGNRPLKGIVVGTQVLEQSLDLDFDVMVSDLAPVDLLLQRAGRLHRHPWREGRPSAHTKPVLYIQCEIVDGELVVGDDQFYTEYLLHKTWEILRERHELNLPTDYRELIELVYDKNEPPADSPLFPFWEKRSKQQIHHEDEARLRLSGVPDPMVPFCQANRNPFHEDEDSNAWVVAQTRLGQETITVIPLTRLDAETATLTPTGERIALNRAASRSDQLRLLRRSLRLSNPTVVGALRQLEKERPRLFSESPLLKRCYPLFLDANGVELTHERRRVQVYMNEELGIVIEKGE